jgi:hypothetical protein
MKKNQKALLFVVTLAFVVLFLVTTSDYTEHAPIPIPVRVATPTRGNQPKPSLVTVKHSILNSKAIVVSPVPRPQGQVGEVTTVSPSPSSPSQVQPQGTRAAIIVGDTIDVAALGFGPLPQFKDVRSDGLRVATEDKNIPDSSVLQGVQRGDSTIDRTLAEGVKAKPGKMYTAEELLEVHQYMDLVFTWVNGSEMTHLFKKYVTFASPPQQNQHRHRRHMANSTGQGAPMGKHHTKQISIEDFLAGQRARIVNGRDRESGELMYSLRSIRQFMQWHKGRIIIVCPGQIPAWFDKDIAFVSRTFNRTRSLWSGPDVAGFHDWIRSSLADYIDPKPLPVQENGHREPIHVLNRITIVHQDAVIPYPYRYSFNTNNIEPYIHKLKGLTNIFVHFNDDYMLGRETNVQTFVNEYGGPNLLFEKNVIRGGRLTYQKYRATKSGKTWIAGVFHTNALITDLLDDTIQASVLDAYGRYADPKTKRVSIHPKRFFVKHSPFVYCRNMHRYIAQATKAQLEESGLVNKFRNYSDVVEPFLHHNIILDAPWRGAEAYMQGALTPTSVIQLNAQESCPPATAKIGDSADSRLMILTDDLPDNQRKLNELSREKPTFMALNDGFTRPEVPDMMREFMLRTFPSKGRYEVFAHAGKMEEDVQATVDGFFQPLRKTRAHREDPTNQAPILPFVMVVQHADYVCPSLRSLQLALPDYEGVVHFLILPLPGETHPATGDKQSDPNPFHSELIDAPSGSHTGMEDEEKVQRWIAPCHVLPDKVKIHRLPAEFRMSDVAKYVRVFGRRYNETAEQERISEQGKKLNTKMERHHSVQFLTVDYINPVFGQTLALEDFEIVWINRIEGKSDGFAIATVNTTVVNMIEAPTAFDLLRTWPLPYRRYERVPWDEWKKH